MINLYETKGVRKFTTKKNNPSFTNTQMALNSRILVVGASGSGKTNWLGNYLIKAENTFNLIHIVYKETEPIYDMLREQLKEKVKFYKSPGELPPLEDMGIDANGKSDPKDNTLLIIDDYVDLAHLYPNLNDIFLRGRKFITTIFLSQSYFKVPKFWRNQLTYIILIRLSGDRDLKLVLSDYSLGIKPEELLKLFKSATKQKFHFLKLDVNSAQMNKKYSHNFKDFYTIKTDESDGESD